MSILDLILPSACGGCGRAGSVWCAACDRSLRPASRRDERFLRADPGIAVGEALEAGVAAFAHEERLRRALSRLKYGSMPRLAGPLAAASLPALAHLTTLAPQAALVPVPVHADRLRDRGYNQALLLARELGRRDRRRPVAEALLRARPTEKQHRLDRAARLRNLAGAFALAVPRAPPSVILVDDILTTSATLESCAAVLRAGGARQVVGFAIAREL